MMLDFAHQGYIYQDILGAYFVAQELANGKGETRFQFDYKKTPKGIPDKFDDLVIYRSEATSFIQIKYSNDNNQHVLTKQDFSNRSSYDLALFDLFETWKALHSLGSTWRICLAWDRPSLDDPIQSVLIQLPDSESLLPGTTCYQFNCDALWPKQGEVLSSWRKLRSWSKPIDRTEFSMFLDCLVLEVNCPKSTLLQDYSQHLEKLLARTIEMIGIGVYPNDHLTVRQVAESLCTIVQRRRATHDSNPISCDEIAHDINIIQAYGGVEQEFPIDKNVLVATPERIDQVVSLLSEHRAVVLTAEPGAGKSWLIENLQAYLGDTVQVIKHYCYIALEDPLGLKRITTNVLYGSLITQILKNEEELSNVLPKRYASNLEQLNILLGKIKKKTLLIVDGIDHIWRVYQKNRGGITEDETEIIQALALLDYSNPNISLLIVSQPIEQLASLETFHHCTLSPLSKEFVQELLVKHALPDNEVGGVSLAQMIQKKSNGNALYIKYLIDHAVANKTQTTFEWITALPSYDFNLTSYYYYLYEQIQGDTRVPCAFCGADFSLTETELQGITHLGSLISIQLVPLMPILRYVPALGYSIYHESFKRFVIDTITIQGGSINHLVYRPLIEWLETQPFFKSAKAYGHLLKLYYEVDAYDAILRTISVDFIDDSLYYAQPFHSIKKNHNLQKATLQHVGDFAQMIIIAEQSKIVYEIEHNITDKVLIKYLKAIQKIHGDDEMYRVLWDGEQLLVDTKDALRFLVHQAYLGMEVIHWSIIPNLPRIPYEILGLVAVKLLHMRQYQEFDDLVKEVYEDQKHRRAFGFILDEVDWWFVYRGADWITNTPYFRNLIATSRPSVSTLEEAIERIISNDRFEYDDDWETMVRDVVMLAKTASEEEIETATQTLSQYNWFRNWLIYLIKINVLLQRDHEDKDIVDAFSYLVRDLEPFKGEPRVCDLYKQLRFIKRTFHQGLLLCKGDKKLLAQCCELLERVTDLTTSLMGAISGPLTGEEYLELISSYVPGEHVINKYEKYYGPLGSRRVYSEVAEIAFEYAYVMSSVGKDDEAKARYHEGIQALTAYGYRKDRTLSEILQCSVPYHRAYGTLGVDWFFELYQMALTVVAHTDGRSTSSYPIECFEEFIKVYPDEALKFLISETFENSEANWYQEEEFHHVLEDHASLFSSTQWFLLCRSLPLASSNKILAYGISVFDQVDNTLHDTFSRWLQSRPFILNPNRTDAYSQEISSYFDKVFGINLGPEKIIPVENNINPDKSSPSPLFSATSGSEALAFFEANNFQDNHVYQLQQILDSITDWEEKKAILREAAKSLRFGRDIGTWVGDFLEKGSRDWLYFCVCLFVFVRDGWFHGLQQTKYLKRAYDVDPVETLRMLKEILGYYLYGDTYPSLIACNLICALSELQVDERMVTELFQITQKIVKRRLPHPPSSEINVSFYQGLDGFNRDEIIVAILIARLKTLTTEKTQGIIWALTFIAQTAPKTLFKPYSWFFMHQSFLLPIHRALLLQVLREYVDQRLIPDTLIGQIINNYPTGYFLEDQYIRSFVDYRMELNENAVGTILHEAHQYDDSFFPYIHPKYRTLVMHLGTLTGTYRAYVYRRDKISREYEAYSLRTEKIVTPIVPNANAAYEIINRQYYGPLKDLTKRFHPSYNCNLRFMLAEIILQAGALTRRPSSLPTPGEFPLFEIRDLSFPLDQEGWVVLASKEKELYGEQFEPKKERFSSLVITTEETSHEEEYYARYIFITDQYMETNIDGASVDQPICELTVFDTLERSYVVYVSPFVVRELGLKIDFILHNGFCARNNKGEIIIKVIAWKEDYYGAISDGTEVPRLDGVAVVIRKDYYEPFLALYQKKSKFILWRSNADG